MEINIGIDAGQREKIAKGLSRLLADTYTLYLKTHNFHWNVTGPMFNTLHLMFEGQYNELALAVDLIAERIRALGVPAPGSYREFGKLTSIAESEGSPDASEMIRQLARGPGGGGAHRAQRVPRRRRRARRADRRPAHPAHAGAREERLDAAEPAREVSLLPPPGGPPPPRATVLVASSDSATRDLLRRVLDVPAVEVVDASDGVEALALARRLDLDLVVLDAFLAVMDGLSVCARIRALTDLDQPPILVLGLSSERSIEVALTSGADETLAKPLNPALLRYRARVLLVRRQEERRLRLLQRAVEAAPFGVALLDARSSEYEVALANPAFLRQTGYGAGEILGKNLRLLAGPATDVAAMTDLRQAMAEGRPTRVLLRSYRKDGAGLLERPRRGAGGGRRGPPDALRERAERRDRPPRGPRARGRARGGRGGRGAHGRGGGRPRPGRGAAPLHRDDPERPGLGHPRHGRERDGDLREPRGAADPGDEPPRLHRALGGRALRAPRGRRGGDRGLRPRAPGAPARLPADQPGRDPVLRRHVDHPGPRRVPGRGGVHLPLPGPGRDDRHRDRPEAQAARRRPGRGGRAPRPRPRGGGGGRPRARGEAAASCSPCATRRRPTSRARRSRPSPASTRRTASSCASRRPTTCRRSCWTGSR